MQHAIHNWYLCLIFLKTDVQEFTNQDFMVHDSYYLKQIKTLCLRLLVLNFVDKCKDNFGKQ
jgi:hypothetical protein